MQKDQVHKTNELLERIAIALEKNNANVLYNGELKNIKDIPLTVTNEIPGFEGTLDELDNIKLTNHDDDTHNDYLNDLVQGMSQMEFLQFHSQMEFSFASNDSTAMSDAIYELEYEECLGAIRQAFFIKGDDDYVEAIECSGFDKEKKDVLARDYVIDLVKENTTDPYADDPNLEVQMNLVYMVLDILT